MKKIFLIGNLLVDEDSMPLKLKPMLQKEFPRIEFLEFDPTENFPEESDEICMIDSVKGINEPRIFTDIDEFIIKKRVSMHDFDLSWEMKLLKKTGRLKKIFIIGIPQTGDNNKIFEQIKPFIEA
jgi:hypothetical protein